MLAQLVENKEQLTLFIEHSPVSLQCSTQRIMDCDPPAAGWLSDYRLEGKQLHGKNTGKVFPENEERWNEIHQRC